MRARSSHTAGICVLLAVPASAHQLAFRSSLTAAVIISPGHDASKASAVSTLGCREVALRWSPAARAERYAVYVSDRMSGPWSVLPPANVCGAVRWTGATGVVDREPTSGAPSVVHRLYYKVFALRGAGDAAAPIDVTDPVVVEMP